MYADFSELPTMPSFANAIEAQTLETVIEIEPENSIASSHQNYAMTASGIHKICTETGGEFLSTSAMRYLEANYKKRFNDAHLERQSSGLACDWGNENELKAISAFEKLTGLEVKNTGDEQAALTFGENVVCHPDGLICEHGEIEATLEVKCPYNPEIHLSYCEIKTHEDLKRIAPNYYYQILTQGLTSGVFKAHFVSYDPRNEVTPIHHVVICAPDEDIAFLKNRIALAVEYLSALENENAKAVAFQESVAPIVEIKQLPTIDLDVGLVVAYHDNPAYLVNLVAEKAGSFVFDCSISKGREACRSHSASIIKTISPVLNASKMLAADAKKVIEKDLNFRKGFEVGVRDIAERTRQPLTEWEREQERIATEAKAIEDKKAADIQAEIDYQTAHQTALDFNEMFEFRREKARAEQAEREAQLMVAAVLAEQQRAERERQAIEAKKQVESERLEHRIECDDFIIKALEKHGFSFSDATKIVILALNHELGALQIVY